MRHPTVTLLTSRVIFDVQHTHHILHPKSFRQTFVCLCILGIPASWHIFASSVVPGVLQHLTKEVVLEVDHCVVDQRRKLQVVIRDFQFPRFPKLFVLASLLASQDARDGQPRGIEHRTLSEVVQHMVIRSLRLLGTELAEVIHMVSQSLQGQFAMQFFEPITPLLHGLVRLPVRVLLLDHQVSCRLHREDADATAQTIIDIPECELLVKANLRTCRD